MGWRDFWGTGWSRPRWRGEYLLMWGLIHIGFGLSLLMYGPTTEASRFIHLFLPPPMWGVYAIVGAAAAVIASLRKEAAGLSVLAFVLIGTLIAGRAVGVFLSGVALSNLALLAPLFIWLPLLRVHIVIARWPNPREVRPDPIVLSEALTTVLADYALHRGEPDPRIQEAIREVAEDDSS